MKLCFDRPWWELCLIAAVAMLMAACAKDAIRLDMRYPEGAVNDSTVRAAPACTVRIDTVTDSRENKESLGSFSAKIGSTFRLGSDFATPVYGDDVTGWVRRALIDMRSLGYGVDDANAVSQSLVRMDVNLKQAYVRNVNSSLESVVRLTIRYTRPDDGRLERSYRGGYTKVNWASGANEIMGSLNHAMIQIIRDIVKDLPEMCGV